METKTETVTLKTLPKLNQTLNKIKWINLFNIFRREPHVLPMDFIKFNFFLTILLLFFP